MGGLPLRRSRRRFAAVSGVLVVAAIVTGAVVLRPPTARAPDVAGVPSPSEPSARPILPTAAPTARRSSSPRPSPTPTPTLAPPPPSNGPLPRLGTDCESRSGARERAQALIDGRLILPLFEAVPMPSDPTWTENPFGDRHWQFVFHSLRIVWDLMAEWQATEDDRARDLALFLVRDWVRDNPPASPRSTWSWNDHATAFRALAIACLADTFPTETWLRDALATHGRILASPSFYVRHGNHALNQNRGLLAAGCVLGRQPWIGLATDRLAALVRESVDDQGVTNEQSVFYEGYNYRAYRLATERLRACDVKPPADLARIDRMPEFLAHATLPDGTYTSLGHTNRNAAPRIPGTIAEFAATLGESGPAPTSTYARYDAGFLFSRSGWGDIRPFADEVAMSLRFGPGRQWHGHDDGGSVTLYGFGRRLVEDPGAFGHNYDAWHEFALSRRAHNVVVVPGLAYDPTVRTRLIRAVTSATHDDTIVSNAGYAGVDHRRRVLFSHRGRYLVVEDVLNSGRRRTFQQLWHLDAGLEPVVDGTTVRTTGDRGNVTILQLAGSPTIDVVSGQRRPLQGWVSFRLGHRTPSPVVIAASTGRSVRYLTLVVPTAGSDDPVRVTGVTTTETGWSFVIEVAGRQERVIVRGDDSTIEVLSPRT